MTLPGFKTERRQQRLFDEEISGHAYARNILGSFVEDLTAHLFRGRRFKTDSRCEYCPDVLASGIYLECKSAGKSRQTFIYAGRLVKDRAFAQSHRLAYVIWHHTASVATARTERELLHLLLANMKWLYLVPFEFIDDACQGIKLEPLNSKYGGTDRNVYGSGYRLRISLFEPFKIPWEKT